MIGRRRWFLGGSTEWPGVAPADVEIGNLDALAARYPAVAAELRAIAASVWQAAPAGTGPRQHPGCSGARHSSDEPRRHPSSAAANRFGSDRGRISGA